MGPKKTGAPQAPKDLQRLHGRMGRTESQEEGSVHYSVMIWKTFLSRRGTVCLLLRVVLSFAESDPSRDS
jgi:hypothetical protein